MLKKHFHLISTGIIIGLLSGIMSSSFLYALNFVTNLREENQFLVWCLPLLGLISSLALLKLPQNTAQSFPSILDDLKKEKSNTSFWMGPYIFISAIGTHLFGGSAGREGVGVIMGVSASQIIPKFFHCFSHPQHVLIYCGIAAGFSSMFGTPLAAIVFAFEIERFSRRKEIELTAAVLVSSMTAYFVSHLIGPSHPGFKVEFHFSSILMIYVLVAGVMCGIGGNIFYYGMRSYSRLLSKIFPASMTRLVIGGLIVSILIFVTSSYEYAGIGVKFINKTFQEPTSFYDFIMKFLLTILTLSAGFKGGEVTPLFFMGATLTNASLVLLNLKNFALSAALGMVGLFGAVTSTPLASSFMAYELFGWKVGILSLFSCYLAKFLMRNKSVYRI